MTLGIELQIIRLQMPCKLAKYMKTACEFLPKMAISQELSVEELASLAADGFDWIESGLDEADDIDEDVKDCADMLWDVAKQAAKTGVSSR